MDTEYYSSILALITVINADIAFMDMVISLFLLLILLLTSTVLSASELVYSSVKPDEIRSLKTRSDKKAKKAVALCSVNTQLVHSVHLARNIINIAFIFLTAMISMKVGGESVNSALLVAGLAVLTFILLITGDVLARLYASKNRIGTIIAAVPLLEAVQLIFEPVSSFLLSPLRLSKRAVQDHAHENGNESDPAVTDEEKILKGIANFGNTSVSAIMVPRIDVTAIDIKLSFDKIITVIINSGFSRIPVYSGTFDTVKGILYAKDVLPFAGNPPGFKWQALLRPSYFVPETKKINDLLKEFQLRKIHMAIVIDEYGGTSGIVTLEDILEEIVGDITDESDEEETLYRRIDESKYIFEGKILLQEFCRVMSVDEKTFEVVRGESETLAGLMLELSGEIPPKDHEIKFREFVFRIESVDKRRIKEILVERIPVKDESTS